MLREHLHYKTYVYFVVIFDVGLPVSGFAFKLGNG